MTAAAAEQSFIAAKRRTVPVKGCAMPALARRGTRL